MIFLRSASVLTLIHCVGHTVSGVLSGPTHGAEESAVIENMKSHAFNFGGLQRNYWDFHLGYGWFLTVLLFVLALVFWNLAGVAKTNSLLIRPILGLFCLNFLAMAIVALEVFLSGSDSHRTAHCREFRGSLPDRDGCRSAIRTWPCATPAEDCE